MIHAVGPVYQDGTHGEPAQLANCYHKCLELAEERGARTVSFPAISTGAYGYPAEEAAAIALDSVAQHFELTESGVREVMFVLFDQGFYELHARAASRRFHVNRLKRHA